MTLQDEYTTSAVRAQDAWATAAASWTQNLQKVVEQVPAPVSPVAPVVDPTVFVERWFDFFASLNEANRQYVRNLAGATTATAGAVRQHVEDIGEVVRGQVQAVSNTAIEQVERVEQVQRDLAEEAEKAEREHAEQARQAEVEQAKQARQAERERAQELRAAERKQAEEAEKAEQAEREQARQVRAAEREQARQARQTARERYEGLPKAELSEKLAERDLPKTGNVDELVERLVDADTK